MNGKGTGSVIRKEVFDGIKDGKAKYEKGEIMIGSEARQEKRKAQQCATITAQIRWKRYSSADKIHARKDKPGEMTFGAFNSRYCHKAAVQKSGYRFRSLMNKVAVLSKNYLRQHKENP